MPQSRHYPRQYMYLLPTHNVKLWHPYNWEENLALLLGLFRLRPLLLRLLLREISCLLSFAFVLCAAPDEGVDAATDEEEEAAEE